MGVPSSSIPSSELIFEKITSTNFSHKNCDPSASMETKASCKSSMPCPLHSETNCTHNTQVWVFPANNCKRMQTLKWWVDMTWHKEIISIDVKTMHKFSHKMLIFTAHKNSSKIQCSNWSREMLALAMNHFTNVNIIFTNNSNKLHLLPLLQDPVMNPIISLQGQAQCQGGDMLTNVWACHHDLLDSLPTNKIICQWLIG